MRYGSAGPNNLTGPLTRPLLVFGTAHIVASFIVQNTIMPPPQHATIQLLRMKYKSAYEAYQTCVAALREASIAGASPSGELLERATKAARVLDEARRTFMTRTSEVVRSGKGETST